MAGAVGVSFNRNLNWQQFLLILALALIKRISSFTIWVRLLPDGVPNLQCKEMQCQPI